jgi:hypothetical protein
MARTREGSIALWTAVATVMLNGCTSSTPAKNVILDETPATSIVRPVSQDREPVTTTSATTRSVGTDTAVGTAPVETTPIATVGVADSLARAAGSTPEVAAVIRDAEAYYAAYLSAYLALPKVDVASIVELSVPGSDSAKATKTELEAFISDGIRVRRNTPDIDSRRIRVAKQIDKGRVLLRVCQENNWVQYQPGATDAVSDDEILNDVLGTTITDEEWVYLNGKWRPETLRNRESYEGQKCDTFY